LAVEWAIVRDPGSGKALNEAGTLRAFTFEGAKSIGLPTLTVVYECDAQNITIHDALFAEPRATVIGRA